MKKSGLMGLLLLLASGFVHATEWTQIGETTVATIYLDKSGVMKSGDFRKAWTMTSFKDGSAPAYHRSYKQLSLYSCTARTSVREELVQYADTQARGSIVWSHVYPTNRPELIFDGTPAAAVLAEVCK